MKMSSGTELTAAVGEEQASKQRVTAAFQEAVQRPARTGMGGPGKPADIKAAAALLPPWATCLGGP